MKTETPATKNEYLGYRKPGEFELEFQPELRGLIKARGRINGRKFYAFIGVDERMTDEEIDNFARGIVENMQESEIEAR